MLSRLAENYTNINVAIRVISGRV